jgi:hypothetical protein
VDVYREDPRDEIVLDALPLPHLQALTKGCRRVGKLKTFLDAMAPVRFFLVVLVGLYFSISILCCVLNVGLTTAFSILSRLPRSRSVWMLLRRTDITEFWFVVHLCYYVSLPRDLFSRCFCDILEGGHIRYRRHAASCECFGSFSNVAICGHARPSTLVQKAQGGRGQPGVAVD